MRLARSFPPDRRSHSPQHFSRAVSDLAGVPLSYSAYVVVVFLVVRCLLGGFPHRGHQERIWQRRGADDRPDDGHRHGPHPFPRIGSRSGVALAAADHWGLRRRLPISQAVLAQPTPCLRHGRRRRIVSSIDAHEDQPSSRQIASRLGDDLADPACSNVRPDCRYHTSMACGLTTMAVLVPAISLAICTTPCRGRHSCRQLHQTVIRLTSHSTTARMRELKGELCGVSAVGSSSASRGGVTKSNEPGHIHHLLSLRSTSLS